VQYEFGQATLFMTQWHIGEILIQKKLIDWEQLEDALSEQKRTREFVGEVLVRKQYIPKYLLFKALAERHTMPFVDLSHVFIDPRAIERVPKSVAVKYGFIPIEIQKETLVVGASDPRAVLPNVEIAALAGVSEIRTVLCTPEAVDLAIKQHYGGQNAEIGALI
jgi:type IV pilus assembly protein PilB